MAPVDFGNLKTETGIAKLNEHLVTRSYITGYQPTQDDVTTIGKMLSAPDAKKYPHAARWFKHISHFTANQKKAFKAGEMAAAKKAAKDEDEIDLFGASQCHTRVSLVLEIMARRHFTDTCALFYALVCMLTSSVFR
jgi:hypothetical protein